MINELMQKVKENNEKNSLVTKKRELKERRNEIEKQRKEIQEKLEQLNYVKTKNNVIKKATDLFNKYFRKQKYLDGQTLESQYNDLNAQDDKLYEEWSNIFNELRNLYIDDKDEREYDERTKEIDETIKSPEKSVEYLLKHYPELAEREEFLSEAIEINPITIAIDKTNSVQLYKKFVQEMIERMSNQNDDRLFEDAINIYQNVLSELNGPKQTENGKYKIPQKYLLESLRLTAGLIEHDGGVENCLAKGKSGAPQYINSLSGMHGAGLGTVSYLSYYLRMDGELPQEFGEFMENLYDNEDYVLLQHVFNPIQEPNKQEVVYTNGKQESTHENVGNKALYLTTTGNHPDLHTSRAGFVDFLEMTGKTKILINVPKKAFDKDNKIPIWGSDQVDGPAFILPEYVLGTVNNDLKFESNPIPKEERKKYKYHYKNESKEPIVETREQKVDEEGR